MTINATTDTAADTAPVTPISRLALITGGSRGLGHPQRDT